MLRTKRLSISGRIRSNVWIATAVSEHCSRRPSLSSIDIPTLVALAYDDMPKEIRSLTSVIGNNLRTLRTQRGQTQDELARSLRQFGLELSRSALAGIESGSGRSLDLGEIALICSACEVSVDELVQGDGEVRLTSRSTVDLSTLRSLLKGEPSKGRGSPQVIVFAVSDIERAALGDAEAKAARKFDVEPVHLSQAAFLVWGRSFTDERDLRVAGRATQSASTRTLQAVRGRVTRDLIEELSPLFEKAN